MKKISALLFSVFFLYLLISPEDAACFAREGLLLWYHSVLPVLFPFMLLCSLILQLGLLDLLPDFICRPFEALFGCSRCGAFTIIAGFFCGFPMGAKLTSDLLEHKKISRREAYFLYGFVNNLSPGFILSYLAADQFGDASLGILFLVNILGSALLYGLLTSISFRKKNAGAEAQTFSRISSSGQTQENFFAVVDNCIYDSIRSAVKLGAYIMIFCILSGIFTKLLPVSRPPALLAASCLEVTNGIHLVSGSALAFPVKFILASAVGAFGGLSALAQTAGIAKMDRALFFHYIKSRVVSTLLSVFMAVCQILFSFFFL